MKVNFHLKQQIFISKDRTKLLIMKYPFRETELEF